MLTNIEILVLTMLSVAGALFVAVLGWLDSGEDFVARKFVSSILSAFLAGVLIAGASFVGMDSIANGWTYLLAFLSGAGIDVLANRGAGAISARSKTTTKPMSGAVP